MENAAIRPEMFQYYDKGFLARQNGRWFFKTTRLNVFAAIDFAYSLKNEADYTAIVVVGVDQSHNYFILDIDRFKTNKISEYFSHILRLHQKWDFRKIRAEVTAAQDVIVKDLKESYIRPHGLALSVEDYRPSRNEGVKEERMNAILQPRYANLQMWHYRGGNCQTLEDELVLTKPPHDDVKDCLASCVDICVAPTGGVSYNRSARESQAAERYHPRFGGVSI